MGSIPRFPLFAAIGIALPEHPCTPPKIKISRCYASFPVFPRVTEKGRDESGPNNPVTLSTSITQRNPEKVTHKNPENRL